MQTIALVLVIEMDRIRINQALVIEYFVLSKYSPNKTVIKYCNVLFKFLLNRLNFTLYVIRALYPNAFIKNHLLVIFISKKSLKWNYNERPFHITKILVPCTLPLCMWTTFSVHSLASPHLLLPLSHCPNVSLEPWYLAGQTWVRRWSHDSQCLKILLLTEFIKQRENSLPWNLKR